MILEYVQNSKLSEYGATMVFRGLISNFDKWKMGCANEIMGIINDNWKKNSEHERKNDTPRKLMKTMIQNLWVRVQDSETNMSG
jgi:hypothetical protein